MQKPTTPIVFDEHSGRLRRYAPAAAISRAARSTSSSIRRRPAWAGEVVVLPWYRSGASATKPSFAKRSVTSLMCGTRPHHSWITTTAGPLPDTGFANHPSSFWPFTVKETFSPMCALLIDAGLILSHAVPRPILDFRASISRPRGRPRRGGRRRGVQPSPARGELPEEERHGLPVHGRHGGVRGPIPLSRRPHRREAHSHDGRRRGARGLRRRREPRPRPRPAGEERHEMAEGGTNAAPGRVHAPLPEPRRRHVRRRDGEIGRRGLRLGRHGDVG